jgi:antitoxin component of RelBE/YafQ-DinJ toxin-antitoxin module
MKDTNITFRISPTTKEQWQKVAADNNLSLSALLVVAMNQYVGGLK